MRIKFCVANNLEEKMEYESWTSEAFQILFYSLDRSNNII
jgi:hypothetical protein